MGDTPPVIAEEWVLIGNINVLTLSGKTFPIKFWCDGLEYSQIKCEAGDSSSAKLYFDNELIIYALTDSSPLKNDNRRVLQFATAPTGELRDWLTDNAMLMPIYGKYKLRGMSTTTITREEHSITTPYVLTPSGMSAITGYQLDFSSSYVTAYSEDGEIIQLTVKEVEGAEISFTNSISFEESPQLVLWLADRINNDPPSN